ncbi:MAG: chemotaxis protein CheB, partial [Opitutales bacterium]
MANDNDPQETDGSERSVTIVGVGASAGGLAALKTLLAAVPEDSGLAFVVVMHLSPEYRSQLAELLQPHCRMPVQQVNETMPIEANRVYVIPPGANLNTIDTHLRLTELEENRRDRATIDHFFKTLAETHDGEAAAVVLTGTGTDGTLGLRAIKEAGGLTLAQDPDEAEYDSMPRSAFASGVVDLVLPLWGIPAELARFHTSPHPLHIPKESEPLEETQNRLQQKIFAQLRSRVGHDFSEYKRSTMLRRIDRRMQLQRIPALSQYLERLRNDREEVQALFDDLLITVTEFFRDPPIFERLEREIIPAIFKGKSSKDRVRIWSVGCSTGEEAYSLAMLLMEESSRQEEPPELQVFASDLHSGSITRAREGVYPAEIQGNVSPERLRRFFVSENGHNRVRREVRELVVFAEHNLLRDPPFSRVDLIVCRNLMIYLQRDVQQDVINLFHYALRPEGILLLGLSEATEQSDLFRAIDKSTGLYRKNHLPGREPRLPMAQPRRELLTTGGREESSEGHGRKGSLGGLHVRMVERYAPPSILVSEDFSVVHSSARAGRYLLVPSGELTSSIFKLVRDPLAMELRTALHQATETGQEVRSKPVPVQLEGEWERVVLRVNRASEPELKNFFLIIFDEQSDLPPPGEAGEEGSPSATVQELQAELDLNRQRLQSALEEYETSREEMQASNEEMQSINEELRSTMEELETS